MNKFMPSPDFDRLAEKLSESGRLDLGKRIAVRAGQIAPVLTGNYARSLSAELVDGRVIVTSNDPGAVVIESGSFNQAPMAPIRRAAEELALLKLNPKPGIPRDG